MERADVVHVRADVRVRRVKGRLRPHRGVPLGRYPDEGDVGESRTPRQRGRPAGETESGFSEMVRQKALHSLAGHRLNAPACNTCRSRSPRRRTFTRIKGGFDRCALTRGNVRAIGQRRRQARRSNLASSGTESHVTCTWGKCSSDRPCSESKQRLMASDGQSW